MTCRTGVTVHLLSGGGEVVAPPPLIQLCSDWFPLKNRKSDQQLYASDNSIKDKGSL